MTTFTFWKPILRASSFGRKLFSVFFTLVAGLSLLAVTGCGATVGKGPTSSKTVTSLTVSAASATVAIGVADQLTATATYSDGSTGNVTTTATWSSAQAAVATVNTSGVVTGATAGTAQVTASLSGVTGSTSIKVSAATVTVTAIAVSPMTATLALGGTQQLTATATYSDGSTGDVSGSASWSSSDASLVSVSASGLATGIAPGSASVKATVSGLSGSATVTVASTVVKTLTQLSISPTSAELTTGLTQQFAATATYSDGSTVVVTSTATWSSSATSVATVNNAGLANAVTAGTAKITATFGGQSSSATVTVMAAHTLSSLTIAPSTTSLSAGATQQLSGTATYTDGTTTAVTSQMTWASSNTGVATVSSSGLVTSITAGSATITGTFNGKTATASVTVTANPVSSIAITPNPLSVAVGATQQLTATATYSDHSTADVTGKVSWSVANTEVATISASGLLTPSTSGTTQITATLSNVTATDAISVQIASGTGVNIPTWQVNSSRQGLNDNEQSLTPQNVKSSTFGKLFSYTLDGYAYAEPLLMSNIQVNGAKHNVLYVATENDTVYAFDADTYGTGQPLWSTSLLASGETPLLAASIKPVLGVTSTPAIDPSTNTMYIVSAQNSSAAGSTFRLNALDITTGQQRPGSPITIQASVPGTNSDMVNGVVSLTTACIQRAALLLANGNVYMGFGSCHSGWLLAYNEKTLAQVGVFNASPNQNGEGNYASAGGIWMGGGGPTVDSNGNVYVTTGNGPWDGQSSYSDSVLKFDPTLKNVTDLFTPDDYAYLNCQDTDLAAGGVSLLPGGTQILAGGKSGQLFLVNLNPGSLAGEQPGNVGVAQSLNFNQGLASSYANTCTDKSGTHTGEVNSFEIFGTGASFNGSVYLGVSPTAANVPAGVRQFTYSGGMLSAGTETAPSIQIGSYGTTPFISANGTNDGILWMLDHGTPLQSGTPTAATLRAYDAATLNTTLYNSSQNSADTPGYGIKFTSPVQANGKVYISTGMDPVGAGARGEINVYGLK